ncbi:MAG: DUF934 domain-containing protein [Pseudotabrizicola sp.]|uniref:DUF934 domain-containing protein n=1 Tax=Pseudotabrizicola sp. TaxID=2939647 RepID=UPI0027205CED|nr:DUF934 domain-containing protein [Pseudotabrizicola sp.]MDO8881822.1 DUF934 domain-containing protein [Pseudotabrizicola sp.]MDP2079789.1 DUF934 domain-containing protein [Pseudotabrizicola sp.]MDZ7574790.1 DUF934 domain-containing protein [Pseudotabrizicola sp.]
MSVIVTDTGFAPASPLAGVTFADIASHQGVLDLTHTDDPAAVQPHLDGLHLIRISFPAFSDGRAFTVARRLRMFGYAGELRATGPVIADQYAMARRVGFDSVEIPDDLAARQPADQWVFRADWQAHHYQARLRA